MLKVYTISELTAHIKQLFDKDFVLNGVSIKGEISNFKLHSSGHAYFTLKDKNSIIRCVMFKGSFSRLKFKPSDGMEILANGRVSLYEKDGSYQFYVDFMGNSGVGALSIAFEKLKNKLNIEGLFNEEFKKELPYFPKNIAVITSETGAVVKDIIKIIRNRNKQINIVLFPIHVQGEQSKYDIVESIKFINTDYIAQNGKKVDIIILGRGGGSTEELWSFNEEIVARSIFESEIPIISAVGHETDFTIADFVADRRASTPSNAAEIAVPELNVMLRSIKSNAYRLDGLINRRFEQEKSSLININKKINREIERQIINKQMTITENAFLLDRIIKEKLNKHEKKLLQLSGALNSLNPEEILKLGYALIEKNGKILRSVNLVSLDENIDIKFFDGKITTKVIEVKSDGS